MKSYSLVIYSLLCFVMRCHEGWQCDYQMLLSAEQRQACKSLHDALSSCPSRDVSWHAHGSTHEQDLLDQLDSCDSLSEDSDDEVYEEEQSEEDFPLANRGLDASPCDDVLQVTNNAIQASILRLLIALYTQLPTGKDDKYFSPILRFVVLFSLKQSGQWLPPRRITHLLAVLLFCGREVMMALMHRRLLEHPEERYSE